jgi:hypothetical protein
MDADLLPTPNANSSMSPMDDAWMRVTDADQLTGDFMGNSMDDRSSEEVDHSPMSTNPSPMLGLVANLSAETMSTENRKETVVKGSEATSMRSLGLPSLSNTSRPMKTGEPLDTPPEVVKLQTLAENPDLMCLRWMH